MKLYSTITSERATKAQGGNKFLQIDIKVENRDVPKLSFRVDMLDKESYNVRLVDYETSSIIYEDVRYLKVKKEKGEICEAIGCKTKATRYVNCLNDNFNACEFHSLNLPEAK